MQKAVLLSLTVIIAVSLLCIVNARGSKPHVRPALYAGSWYDGENDKLAKHVKDLIQTADDELKQQPIDTSFAGNSPINGSVLAILAPHAAFMFSSTTDAYAYAVAAKNRKIERVILLGPSHYSGFAGASLPDQSAFATPIGNLDIDVDTVRELRKHQLFNAMPEVHNLERSLEMHLPFIRQAFGPVKIIPIIVGVSQPSELKEMAQILKPYMRATDLVVVSCDFTHYGKRYGYEPFKDDIDDNIRKLDSEALSYLTKNDLPGFFAFRHRTHETICGIYPCGLLMELLPEKSHATVLHYGNSRESKAEEGENRVSYMALAFSDGSDKGWPVTASNSKGATAP